MLRAAVLVCLVATAARANNDAIPDPDANADGDADAHAERATDLVGRPIVLGAGQFAAELTVEINIAHNYWAEPLSLAPDLWWGATSRLTLGIVHSNASVDRFAPGASVCLTEDPIYCDRPYRGGGLDARYLALERAGLALAPRARLLLRDVDPLKPALTAGALAKWTRGRWAITTDPYVQISLANAELGNRSALFIPVQLAVQPTCRWQIALDSGWNSELAVIEDGWHIPIALGVRARATSHVDLGATLGFASLLGPQNTPKQRVLFLSLGWRQ